MTQNIHIDGHGTFSGGAYRSVSVNGLGRCTEPFTCQDITVNGSLSTADITAETLCVNGHLKAQGSITSKATSINGMVFLDENLRTEDLRVDGNLTVSGSLHAENVRVDGRLKCCGVMTAGPFACDGIASLENGLFAQSVDVDGVLTVQGNIEAEHMESDGKISATAQISADTIRLHGMVRADEIVGDSIEICYKSPARAAASFLNSVFGSNLCDNTRSANLIEATSIRLESVCAGVVSGEHVIIGKNCQIDRLDCTGDFAIDPSSIVRLVNGTPYTPSAQ